jgi:hypothetical protein
LADEDQSEEEDEDEDEYIAVSYFLCLVHLKVLM